MIRQSLFKIAFLLIFGCSFISTSETPVDRKLQITVSNIKSLEGNIMVAVFNADQKFLGEDVVAGKIEPVTQTGEMTIMIDGLPFGEYAISVFHDENANEILDANFVKMPVEPYGFSNNARGRFGPPTFEDAKINFTSSQNNFSIRLK